MIDEARKEIYYDFTSGNTFQACKEKQRLGGVRGWKTQRPGIALDFGHAIHAGWAAYYDALAGGYRDNDGSWHLEPGINAVVAAQAAFLRDLKVDAKGDLVLPLTLESGERRSIERGMALLRAYAKRWGNEPYKNVLRPDGSPLTEVGFKFLLAEAFGYKIIHVGYIDRIMESRLTGRPSIVEGKTTTSGTEQFARQVKPNNQITTYFKPANALMKELGLPEITECNWDTMFISDRKPDLNKGLLDPFWNYGISVSGDEKVKSDFKRTITTRSKTDVSELLVDAEANAVDYAKWLLSGVRRWPRSTGACHSYGGCQFRDRCSLNLDEAEERAFMETYFKVEHWQPWKKIMERENDS